MKTNPMEHQTKGLQLLRENDRYMLGCEQGTGKTWMLLADAEQRWAANAIDAVLVLAPKGVHSNWVRREIPAHLAVPHIAEYWQSGATKKQLRKIERLFDEVEEPLLRIFTMNIDAILHGGYEVAKRFLRTYRCIMIIDESHRIKNPESARNKKSLTLGAYAKVKRIASGTPITNSPIDAFGQFEFLGTGLLGTTSYRAFVAEYAQLLPQTHPLVQGIKSRFRGNPQVVARTREGKPIWRNLDKLNRLVAPHMYRVLKNDCLDLPEKIYQTAYFELEPAQRGIYDRLRDELTLEIAEGDFDVFTALTKLTKLQQITSCFVLFGGTALKLQANNPRLDLLMELIEDTDGPFIIWARYREEVEQIAARLAAADKKCVVYTGATGDSQREIAVDAFQAGEAVAFVGIAAAGGVGLTLTAAETVFYYSNDFNLATRLQSEDRAHRIGTTKHVRYIDLVAVDTIDEKIASALQNKEEVAARILGDRQF